MGLLDYDGLTDDPRQQGLLSLGLRLMSTPGKFGQAFGQAGLGAMGDMKAAKRGLLEAEFKRAQMSEMQSQEEQRRALARKAIQEAELALQKRQMEERQDAAYRRDLNPDPISGGQAAGMPPQLDWSALSRKWPGKADQLEKLSKSGDWGMPEVARTMDVEGPAGEKLVRSVDKRGRQVGTDQTGYIAPVPVNTGASTEFRKPTAGLSVPSFMSPGERARLGQARVTEARLAAAGGGGDKTPKPATIVDPANPSQMIMVDLNKWNQETRSGVIGVAGKEPSAALRKDKVEKGQETAAGIIDDLRAAYQTLDRKRAIPSTERNVASNVLSGVAATGVGQFAGRLVGTEAQVERDVISSSRLQLLNAIKSSTGMSAQQLNSNVELQTWLKAVTDPGQSYQAVDRILGNLEKFIASGGKHSERKASGVATNTSPGIGAPPGVDAEDWKHMTPQERSLWKK